MNLRSTIVGVCILAFALAQVYARSQGSFGALDLIARPFEGAAGTAAFAQDNDDNDNDDADNDDDGDNDNDDADNDDDDDNDNDDADNDDDNDDDDNEDDDNDNDDSDNDDDNDDDDNDNGDDFDDLDDELDNLDVDEPGAPLPPGPPVSPTLPLTEAIGTSTGGDGRIALGGERVVVTMFPWLPSGITLVIRRAEPLAVAATPGPRAGDLLFTIEAQDPAGLPLAELPAEVNLSVRYTDQDVVGLDEQTLTISWLDPADNQWKPAPKLARDPFSNYIAASITALGTYAVHAP